MAFQGYNNFGQGHNTVHGPDVGPPPPGFPPGQSAGVAQYGYPAHMPVYVPPAYGHVMPPYSVPYQQNVAITHPANAPVRSGFPGFSFRNPSGGVGVPPGYDYLFPTEHCTIHCFTTGKQAPWQIQIPMSQQLPPHVKCFVPCNMTVKEMMQGLGCNNDSAGKNVLYEISEKGNGLWAKGLTIKGDDKDKVKKKIGEFGWDKSRTGFPGQRPVVWLYLTKD